MCVNRAVFFDRDGILNRIVMRGNKVGSPRSVEEVKFMDCLLYTSDAADDA